MSENSNIQKTDSEIKLLWFSLKVTSGKERIVEENILYEAKINKIEE